MKPQGVSAIEKFYLVLQAVQELDRRRHVQYKNQLYEDSHNVAPISFGTIHGGDWPSTVPDEVVVEGRLGVLPGETMDDARRAMTAAVARAIAVDYLAEKPSTEDRMVRRAVRIRQTPLTEPIVASIKQCHAKCSAKLPYSRA